MCPYLLCVLMVWDLFDTLLPPKRSAAVFYAPHHTQNGFPRRFAPGNDTPELRTPENFPPPVDNPLFWE